MSRARTLTKSEALAKERLAASPKRTHPTDGMNIWQRAAWFRNRATERAQVDPTAEYMTATRGE